MPEIRRRTFEAAKYPKGSKEREELNKSALTSEYMTSYRYALVDNDRVNTFRTKQEAESAILHRSWEKR